MQRLRVVPALRERLGDHGTEALTEMMFAEGQEWRNDVLNTMAARFENRLTHEISAFRVEVARQLSDMRVESFSIAQCDHLNAVTQSLNCPMQSLDYQLPD